jgi:hypothetical protein
MVNHERVVDAQNEIDQLAVLTAEMPSSHRRNVRVSRPDGAAHEVCVVGPRHAGHSNR